MKKEENKSPPWDCEDVSFYLFHRKLSIFMCMNLWSDDIFFMMGDVTEAHRRSRVASIAVCTLAYKAID